jgi:acetyl esterase/lipase
VKANAARYNVDADRVALMGRGMGAHLALMAAYTANDPAYPAGCFEDTPSIDESVQAVVASAPLTDLRLWPAERDSVLAQTFGGLPEDVPDVYAHASPVSRVRPGLPPTMLIHGQRDTIIAPVHSELLANHLRMAGVTSVLLRIPWGRHDVDSLPVGLSGPMVHYDVDRFLAWVFHRQEADA